VIARRDNVRAAANQFVENSGRQTFAVCRIFAVDNNHVDFELMLKFGRPFHKKISAGSADNVSNH
jgi:hypothetical protein